MGLVLRAQGPGQAGWHLLCCLLPTWAAGSSLEGDGLHLGPQGTRQLSAQSHRLASQFLLLCRGVSAQTRHPTKDRGTVIQKKNELPSGTSTFRDTWTGNERPLQRRPHCPQNARVFPVEEGCRQGPSVTISVI